MRETARVSGQVRLGCDWVSRPVMLTLSPVIYAGSKILRAASAVFLLAALLRRRPLRDDLLDSARGAECLANRVGVERHVAAWGDFVRIIRE